MAEEFGFWEINENAPLCEFKFSDYASASFDDIVKEYPDLERTIRQEVRDVPWTGIYRLKTLNVDDLNAIEEQLTAEGLSLKDKKPYGIRKQLLFLERRKAHIKKHRQFVEPTDIDSIVCWFLRRDYLYPEFVESLVDYWRHPNNVKILKDGEFSGSPRQSNFGTLHNNFYFDNKRFPVAHFIPGLRLDEIIWEKIARHYLEESMKGGTSD